MQVASPGAFRSVSSDTGLQRSEPFGVRKIGNGCENPPVELMDGQARLHAVGPINICQCAAAERYEVSITAGQKIARSSGVVQRTISKNRKARVALCDRGQARTLGKGWPPSLELGGVDIIQRKLPKCLKDERGFVLSAPFVDEVVHLALRTAQPDDEIGANC